MGFQEVKAWLYRQNHRPYLWLHWRTQRAVGSGYDYPEIDRKVIKDNGQETHKHKIGGKEKPWDIVNSKPTASPDKDGALHINYVVGGIGESMRGVPIAFPEHLREMQKDHNLARSRGKTIDLEYFARMAKKEHTEGWFGRGRFRLLMILLGVALVGMIALGVAAGYFASQERVVCITVGHDINGTAVPVPCPASVFAHTTTSTTSTFSKVSFPTETTTTGSTVTIGG